MSEDNEQWLSDGICYKCRRANYCKKDCSAQKRRRNKIMVDAFKDTLKDYAPDIAKSLDEDMKVEVRK